MAFTINMSHACRAFDVVLDDVRSHRHMMLMVEFSGRGLRGPSGGSTGPNFVDGKREGIHHTFLLAEEVADEYIARMKPEPTESEVVCTFGSGR